MRVFGDRSFLPDPPDLLDRQDQTRGNPLRHAFSILVVTTAICATAIVSAQQPPAGGQPQPAPTNLQVLAKDMPRPQVIQVMQGFTAALGV